MTDAATNASFLKQFSQNQQDRSDWPEWMKNSARFATASFPKTDSQEKTSRQETLSTPVRSPKK